MSKKIANLLFPDAPDYVEVLSKYGRRSLPTDAIVTRFAPSPTGFIHIGSIYIAYIGYLLSKQTDGVFILRIEDTDQERKIENGVEEIIEALQQFGITPDEGCYINQNGLISEKGSYGPYIQSNRIEIYHSFVKHLIERGYAYPSFQTLEEIEIIRLEQKKNNFQIGYYGIWAKDRYLTFEQVQEYVSLGKKYVIRINSSAPNEGTTHINDVIRGALDLSKNDLDHVLIKQDGLPTYHFAVVVDDTLMGINLVLRGDEWLSTLPLHLELYKMYNFKTPKFAHISPIGKMDGDSKRKLSKRKDPESAVRYYHSEGYPNKAILAYLLTIADSSFDKWFESNRNKNFTDFRIDISKMSRSISLFDLVKLQSLSKEVISSMTTEEVYNHLLAWSQSYAEDIHLLLKENKSYSLALLNIGRSDNPPRKDIVKWADFKAVYGFFFDSIFFDSLSQQGYNFSLTNNTIILKILEFAIDKKISSINSKDEWLDSIKNYAVENNFALKKSDYKNNPSNYSGSLEDIMSTLRVAILNTRNSPDLFQVIQVMGSDRVNTRINDAILSL